jgi:hypothetical protein
MELLFQSALSSYPRSPVGLIRPLAGSDPIGYLPDESVISVRQLADAISQAVDEAGSNARVQARAGCHEAHDSVSASI